MNDAYDNAHDDKAILAKLTSTCQICARPILANTGLIAHHGYTRPYAHAGFQTASCPGARFMPYEMACDALPPYIERLESALATTQEQLRDLINDPPHTLLYYPQPRRGKPLLPPEEVYKPHNFNKEHIPVDRYSQLYFNVKHEREAMIKHLTDDLKFLKARLDAWKAPEDAFTLASMPAPRKSV
jgi:hypothetical protein